MMGHPIVLIGSAVVAIFAVAAAAYSHYRHQQQHQQYAYEYVEHRIPEFERRVLGPCGICRGDASSIDSYQASCGHYRHYTCEVDVTRPSNSGVPIDFSQICMACLEKSTAKKTQGQTNPGLRNRNVLKCANCSLKMKNGGQNIRIMACGHRVHEACWDKMQSSASPTCPACMEA